MDSNGRKKRRAAKKSTRRVAVLREVRSTVAGSARTGCVLADYLTTGDVVEVEPVLVEVPPMVVVPEEPVPVVPAPEVPAPVEPVVAVPVVLVVVPAAVPPSVGVAVDALPRVVLFELPVPEAPDGSVAVGKVVAADPVPLAEPGARPLPEVPVLVPPEVTPPVAPLPVVVVAAPTEAGLELGLLESTVALWARLEAANPTVKESVSRKRGSWRFIGIVKTYATGAEVLCPETGQGETGMGSRKHSDERSTHGCLRQQPLEPLR
jgi:hypothetical protein